MPESVCGDLLNRLESKIPGGNSVILPNPTSPSGDKGLLKDIVEQNRRLLEKMEEFNSRVSGETKVEEKPAQDFPLEEIEKAVEKETIMVENKPSSGPVLEEVEKSNFGTSDTYGELKSIVDKFNSDLLKWYDKSGCVAGFAWRYKDKMQLEICSVDYMVYRKPAPSELTMKAAMEKYKEK